ncbi:MAG: ISNCY family transposase [Gemmataceae bacterium]
MDEVQGPERVAMSQRERDLLKVMQPVLDGHRTQAEAARLLRKSVRQVRRLQRKLEVGGDIALVHGLRGKPSNHHHDPTLKARVLNIYRTRFAGFGPTFAQEKLAAEGLHVGAETLRRWLLAAGLWTRQRHRDPHRSRRPRRNCFGELIQMDASIHDGLEGRGDTVVLITMIDDATSRVMARFYPSATVETHMDLFERWVRKFGRPLAVYTDRHSIFEAHEMGQPLADPDAETQFGRAMRELDIELIRAHSPQAKGRVERSFGTAQDRWVKELRLAKAKTCEQANRVLDQVVPDHNRRFAVRAKVITDCHRRLGSSHRLEAILSIQCERVVSNDYVVRWSNRYFQLLPPTYTGLRGERVVIEHRRDGSTRVRFGDRYLSYREVEAGGEEKTSGEEWDRAKRKPGPRQPKEGSGRRKPAADHPWRKAAIQ